jgi:hypothetical protein
LGGRRRAEIKIIKKKAPSYQRSSRWGWFAGGKKTYLICFVQLVALAHLIMGDGSYIRGGLVLCTDAFSIVDVVRLFNVPAQQPFF